MSKGGYRGNHPDFIQLNAVSIQTPVRVAFRDIGDAVPSVVRAFDNANAEIDLLAASTYNLNSVNHTTRQNYDNVDVASTEIRKQIPYFSFPLYVQAGGSHRIQRRDIRWWLEARNYTPVGGDRSIAPFISPLYVGRENYIYGLKNRPMMSPYITWNALKGESPPFTQTAAQYVAQERQKLTNSQTVREEVAAYFGQAEARLFKNRLHVLSGVRYERADNEGFGPLSEPANVFQRDTNGGFLRGPNGAPLRRPEAGAVGSIEELRLTVKERASHVASNYDGFYPSLHLNYSLTESSLLRVAYAKTYARPPFVATSTTIAENENAGQSGASPGQINIVNSSLKPWTAQNFDLSLEYYSKSGGIFTVGVFRKEIRDFFSSTTLILGSKDLERFGLEPEYLGWNATTTLNSGDARVDGMEFNVRTSLERLGKLGRHVTLFANGTKLHLAGKRDADFSTFVPLTANWGIAVRRSPVMVTARWNYRGEQRGSATTAMGPDSLLYDDDRMTCDISFEYQLSRRLIVFGNVQNVFDVPNVSLIRGPETPGYASRNWTVNSGSTITLGIKGRY
jgi:TonB-dependent receptor